MKPDENGDLKLSEIARKLEIDTSIVINFLFGIAGFVKLGNGLAVNRKVACCLCYSWTMPRKDADEFVRRVKEHIRVAAFEIHKIYSRLNI